MQEALRRLGLAKTAVDRGFSAVGPGLEASDLQARALMLLACRAVATANAVMVLTRHNHEHEALPLLRSLLEVALHARWIAQAGGAARAGEFLSEHERPRWEDIWPEDRMAARGAGLGADLRERARFWCRAHVLGNARGLPWAHVFPEPESARLAADGILAEAARLMEELVKALDGRWPGKFALDGLQER
ncbi:MAG: DUF5677 domain-containing protein [Elusimicrobia bacterium]|nr:DUF5677 domain-containing protein [Elusimicrobiota bacterium]